MTNPNNSSLRDNLLKKRSANSLDAQKFKTLEQKLNTQILSFLEELELKNTNFIKSIAFYYPIKGEPDISSSLITWAKQSNSRELALPLAKKNEPLTFARWNSDSEMTEGLYQIPEPANPELISPDLIIAPCLGWSAFNDSLWRIGYGGGFYDRTLDNLKKLGHKPIFIGVGFESHEVNNNEWEPRPHDIPMDALVTESKIYTPTQ